MALGILMALLGVIGLATAAAFTVTSLFVFGALLVAGGTAQAIEAFPETGWKSAALHAFIAIAYIAAGVHTLYDPVATSLRHTLFVAAMLLAAGVLRSGMAFQMRPVDGWCGVLAGGIVSLLLGVAFIVQWPVSGLLAIGLYVGVELVIGGWTCILFALAARASTHRDRAPLPA
jgi:uncharacterized membrane protein HdeD (DUF308 family)